MDKKWITVFCSSSEILPDEFYYMAKKVGEAIVKNGFNLVYGGGNVGMMGKIANAVKDNQGKVIGVIPKSLHESVEINENLNKLIITKDMHKRKAKMEELADVFLVLPGGYGTLEEFLEVITLKQLKYHDKPIVLFNYANYYDNLLKQFDHLINQKFCSPESKKMYYITDKINKIFLYYKNYNPVERERTLADQYSGFDEKKKYKI